MRLFALLFGLAIFSAADAAAPVDLAAAASDAVLKVHAHYSNGSVAQGSAVIIGPEKLVTNCHVIYGAGRIEVVQGEHVRAATLQAEYLNRDLCYLHAPAVTGPSPRNRAEVAIGQRIFAVGFPFGGALTITEGRVIALHHYDGAKVIQGSAPFEPGSSGGALFDESGRLVGITTFKERKGGPFHFALPAAWLDSVPSGKEQRKPGSTAAFWQHRGDELPHFLRAVRPTTSPTLSESQEMFRSSSVPRGFAPGLE